MGLPDSSFFKLYIKADILRLLTVSESRNQNFDEIYINGSRCSYVKDRVLYSLKIRTFSFAVVIFNH